MKRYTQETIWNYFGILFLILWHSLAGHPKKDCKKVGAISVRCKCGALITLSDFY